MRIFLVYSSNLFWETRFHTACSNCPASINKLRITWSSSLNIMRAVLSLKQWNVTTLNIKLDILHLKYKTFTSLSAETTNELRMNEFVHWAAFALVLQNAAVANRSISPLLSLTWSNHCAFLLSLLLQHVWWTILI